MGNTRHLECVERQSNVAKMNFFLALPAWWMIERVSIECCKDSIFGSFVYFLAMHSVIIVVHQTKVVDLAELILELRQSFAADRPHLRFQRS